MESKFVKEDRMANQVETDAIVKALEGFDAKQYGKETECYAYHLYGRYDAPYGWYLFGISPIEELYGGETFADGQAEKFIILGDCLDVLPDYGRVLTMEDVHEFAIGEMDGRYEAIQEWGVFKSISMKLKNTLANVVGDDGLDESVEWNDSVGGWTLKFCVSFTTDKGADECRVIYIPAQLTCQSEADDAFAAQWRGYRTEYDKEVARTSGLEFSNVLSKQRSIYEIDKAIRYYIDTVRTDFEMEDREESPRLSDGQTYVWVLTIMKDGQNFPEVHTTFDGAVDGVIVDIQEHMDEEEVDDYDFVAIKKSLENDRYWEDEKKEAVYDIAECPLCK